MKSLLKSLRQLLFLLTPGLAACGSVSIPPLGPAEGAFTVTTIVADAEFPVDLAFAPDGRLFYTEKATGRIRLVVGETLADPPLATLPVNSAGERGLLGIALKPGFQSGARVGERTSPSGGSRWPAAAQSGARVGERTSPVVLTGYVYVYYTRAEGGAATSDPSDVLDNRIVRLSVEGNTPAGEEELIRSLPVTGATIHNGGVIRFGPDGKLYVCLGELGNPVDAQNAERLNGKILRLNDDGSAAADNPFGPDNSALALGLRNPFGLAFDEGGRLFAIDNGALNHDEMNRIEGGGNYGWPLIEGVADSLLELPASLSLPGYVDPLVVDAEGSVGVAGLAFNHGNAYGESLRGDLFYGEVQTDRIIRVDLDEQGNVLGRNVFVENLPGGVNGLAFAPDGRLWAATATAIIRIDPP